MCLHAGGGALYEGRGTYGDVLQYAERLFGRIRTAVAVQAAPTTLKAAFLDPITEDLATDVALELFARSDQEYLAMFTGEEANGNICLELGKAKQWLLRAHGDSNVMQSCGT
jgi:hypothetical protein